VQRFQHLERILSQEGYGAMQSSTDMPARVNGPGSLAIAKLEGLDKLERIKAGFVN